MVARKGRERERERDRKGPGQDVSFKGTTTQVGYFCPTF
jgi:hypothetical protein